MTMRRLLCAALFVCGLSGCVIQVDLLGDRGASREDEPAALPAPRPPSGDAPAPSAEEPSLDDAQQARKDEVDKYVREVVYHGAAILDSVMLPSGDVVDFLDRDMLPPSPELPVLPFALEDLTLPPGVELGRKTATPFHRPTFWAYVLGETDATSMEDYLDRYTVGGAPSGAEHLHAGWVTEAENRGASSFMNQFHPHVENDTFSLMEMVVACPAEGPVQEMIGVVISVDKVNAFGKNGKALTDDAPRLHVEYAVPDPSTGMARYRWDGSDGKFVPNAAGIRHHVGETVPVSEIGGMQVEHHVAILQNWSGDWWVVYQGEILGHYPKHLFQALNGLNGAACRTAWYGEVARRKPDSPTPWTETAMGSGKFPDIADPSDTAYVRTPMFYDTTWIGKKAEQAPYAPMVEKTPCYTHSDFQDGILPGDRLFYVGGTGGKDPAACVWP